MKPKLLSVQYLRALAALLVVFHHTRNPQDWLFDPWSEVLFGGGGVDIFFVISGFVMFTAARHEQVGEFIKRRIIRIVPLYWLVTLALVGEGILRSKVEVSPELWADVLKSLFFVPSYSLAEPAIIHPYLVPGWTLNYEMFFYLLFAVGLCISRPLWFVTIAIIGLIAAGLWFDPSGAVQKTYTNPLLLEFLAGMWIGFLYSQERIGVSFDLLLPLGLVLLFVTDALPVDRIFNKGIPAIMILIAALSIEVAGNVPRIRLLKLLGDASYSIYLSNTLMLAVILGLWKRLSVTGWIQFSGLVVFGVLVAAIAGVAMHLIIEKPMLRALLRRPADEDLTSVKRELPRL
jgi:exopolysaccharide production protein ExoZ